MTAAPSMGTTATMMPPPSPELETAERLWSLVNEAVVNGACTDLEGLMAVLPARCRTLRTDRATIHDLTCYG